jgi:leucyl aminopeptidase (aminopeptidase T)
MIADTHIPLVQFSVRLWRRRNRMNSDWPHIARRIVQGLGVQPGELIQVRGDAGRFSVWQEILLAVELVGATPLPEITPFDYMQRLWSDAPRDYLAKWDQHRVKLLTQVDRVVSFQRASPDFSTISEDAFDAWRQAVSRLTALQDERRLPFLVVAAPTEQWAQPLSMTLEELEATLLPALGASVAELEREIERALEAVGNSQAFTIRTGDTHELHLKHGDRSWLSDDGCIDLEDQAQGAIVSNLPAGSIYTTVLETETQGSLWLPKAGAATDVVLYFDKGRIVEIEAASGADMLSAWLDSNSGEPRRVGHIGIGLNPYLERSIGWTLVDEHVHGHLFLSLGDNRYMGGHNASSLNVDYTIPQATLIVDRKVVISEGKVVA